MLRVWASPAFRKRAAAAAAIVATYGAVRTACEESVPTSEQRRRRLPPHWVDRLRAAYVSWSLPEAREASACNSPDSPTARPGLGPGTSSGMLVGCHTACAAQWRIGFHGLGQLGAWDASAVSCSEVLSCCSCRSAGPTAACCRASAACTAGCAWWRRLGWTNESQSSWSGWSASWLQRQRSTPRQLAMGSTSRWAADLGICM